jgi:pimeloyl-ACP methyl ester carboxylesterase
MKAVRNVALLTAAAAAITLLFLWLPTPPRFVSQPQPAQDYATATTLFEQLQAKDSDDLFPECRSRLLTHGELMTRTIVFFHGISSCPAQFEPLGTQFFELGYNVLIPRLPHHGGSDRMAEDAASLTAEELVTLADETVDIATGLGEHVTVTGFSTGGAMATWIAMERPEVDQVVLISPFLSPRSYPAWMIRPLSQLLLLLPNRFWWWDEELKEEIPGPRFAHPRYPSHAMAEIMRLSLSVQQQAAVAPPQSGSILVITNTGPQETVDNKVTQELIEEWQQHGLRELSTFEFDSTLDLEHDYITLGKPDQTIDPEQAVYPILIELIAGSAP